MYKTRNIPLKESDIARFWNKVAITANPDKCWEWMAYKDPIGYGQINIGRRAQKAHRVSCLIFYGSKTNGLHCLHKCNNPSCVNPAHLYLGTHQENMDDMPRSGHNKVGSQQKGAKLTEEKVREIRRIRVEESATQNSIANKYGVCRQLISEILLGRRWNHVI